MEKDKTTFPEIIWGAFVTATMFMPVHYLSNILSWKINDSDGIILFVIPFICGLFSAASIFSVSPKCAFLKWILSLPISFAMWLYFFNRDFYIRSLNWVIPDYGEAWAGGGFAGFIEISFLALIVGVFSVTAIFVSRKINNTKVENVLFAVKIVSSIICICIILIVFHLNTIMPQYKPVYG